MHSAEAILRILRERGERGLALERIYRLLYNPELYLLAYTRLYHNAGATTPGSTPETVDGMSLATIERLIDTLRHERYRWTPVRRVYVPKKGGQRRPLGIPSWRDKLLQEVMRSLLEAYFEPQFSDMSHGFRPSRGCHTALSTIQHTWTGTRWFIEGDIAQYFDTIDHDVLLLILRQHIHDERFLKLLGDLLGAGYLEDWKLERTLSGTPQGGILSPLLANIYLDRFDQWVASELLPAYTRGNHRRANPLYVHLIYQLQRARARHDAKTVRAVGIEKRTIACQDPFDATYRRLRYIRYADDFLLGFIGSHAEAEAIKQMIGEWLRDHLKLTLSRDKTVITHAATESAHFLGYEICTQRVDDKLDLRKRRATNGKIGLRVPAHVLDEHIGRYMRHGKPHHRPELLNDSDFAIVSHYQQEYRGIVQYYLLATNVSWFARLQWVMETSLLKTLACKHRRSVAAMAGTYKKLLSDPDGGQMHCIEVRVERDGRSPLIARFGGMRLRRRSGAVLDDMPPMRWNRRSELVTRLLAAKCEYCGSTERIEVHHIRKLADLNRAGRRPKEPWERIMIARKRKTLVLCRSCHIALHAGTLQSSRESSLSEAQSSVREATQEPPPRADS